MKLLSNRETSMFSDRKDRIFRKAGARLAGGSRGLILYVAMAGLVTALLAGGYRERLALAQQTPTTQEPDYSNVNDILNGRRHLLRTDDLVVVNNTNILFDDLMLTTANSAVTNVTGLNNNLGGSGVIRSGRLFNLPYDVPVRIAGEGDWVMVYATDPTTGNIPPAIRENIILSSAIGSLELADFNGDGYSDIAVSQHTPAKGGGLMSVTASKAVELITLIFDSEHALCRH